MPNLMPFHFDAHEVRVYLDEGGDPWWIARDVCEVLGLTHTGTAVKRLAPHEKGVHPIYTPGGVQDAISINESGLYRLIFRSDKPEAMRFQAWVFEDVLPQIRKTGKYDPSSALDRFPELKAIVELAESTAQARLIAEEARAEAQEARGEAREANANALRALESQLFFTVAEYVYVNKLQRQIREEDYKACSDHLRIYCYDHKIPFRPSPVGGKKWKDEWAFLASVYAEVLPGWLKRRFAQTNLRILDTPHKETTP